MILPRSSLLRPDQPVDVLLLATNSGMAFAAARCLDLAGLRFHLVAPGRYWTVQTMRSCVGASVLDPAVLREPGGVRLLAALRRAVAAHPDLVVVPAGIEATFLLAALAPALEQRNVFPLSPEPLLRDLHDKWVFAQLLAGLGVPHPTTRLLERVEDVGDVEATGPLVVKPQEAEGSQGVRIVRSHEELRDCVAAVERSGLLPVLLQDFVPGDDLALGLVARHGEVLGSRLHQYLPDGDMLVLDRPDAVALAAQIVAATGAHGVFNIDLRRDARDDAVWVTECNPRLYATSHKSAYAGMNPVEVGVRMARGLPVEIDGGEATVVGPPVPAMVAIARRRGGSVPSATRAAVRAEVVNPVSSALRSVEWRVPALARAARGEQPTGWEAFQEATADDDGVLLQGRGAPGGDQRERQWQVAVPESLNGVLGSE